MRTALIHFHKYLTNRHQRIKINNSHSAFNLIKYGVLQGFILGPILIAIDISSYANDNTPYYTNNVPDAVETTLKTVSINIYQ